jgi:hypothetical protein
MLPRQDGSLSQPLLLFECEISLRFKQCCSHRQKNQPTELSRRKHSNRFGNEYSRAPIR